MNKRFLFLFQVIFLLNSLNNFLIAELGTICFHNLSKTYYLGVEFRYSGGDDWHRAFLDVSDKSKKITVEKHGLGSADVRDMVVSIFRKSDMDPIDLAVWSTNIDVKNGKNTDVYFKMVENDKIEIDKRLNKKWLLVRKVKVDGDVKENYLDKHGADTKLRHFKIILSSIFNGSFKRQDSKIDLDKWVTPNKQLRLNEICLLASHNSFSSYQDGYRFYYQQYYDIKKQFNMGVRCFLLDCYPTKPGKNIDIKKGARPVEAKLCHGKCELGPILRLQDNLNYTNFIKAVWAVKKQKKSDYVTMTLKESLKILKDLVEKNKDEIICIELENYIDIQTTDKIIEESGISSITLNVADWDIFENQGQWPTLDWMIKNNKRVIFWANNGPSKYVYNQWEIQRSNMYGCISVAEGVLTERTEPIKKLDNNIKKLEEKNKDINLKLENSKNEEEINKLKADISLIDKKIENLRNFKHLSAVNLFPGSLLAAAEDNISIATKKLQSESEIREALSALIKAVRNIKLYWDINYSVLNERILSQVIQKIINNGLSQTGSLKGQMPNILNLDQVHEGNSMKLINKLNAFAARRLNNPNLKIESIF